MQNSEIFYGELQLIQNQTLREITTHILNDLVPDYFYYVSASSTGKYHPWYSLGYGGLVRHTKAAVKIANDLLSLEQNQNLPHDEIIIALILHDSFKHGKIMGQYTVSEHPLVASVEIREWLKTTIFDEKYHDTFAYICDLISSHMGQWNTVNGKELMPKPITDAQKFVHTCDYLASRKYIIVEVN